MWCEVSSYDFCDVFVLTNLVWKILAEMLTVKAKVAVHYAASAFVDLPRCCDNVHATVINVAGLLDVDQSLFHCDMISSLIVSKCQPL